MVLYVQLYPSEANKAEDVEVETNIVEEECVKTEAKLINEVKVETEDTEEEKVIKEEN